MPDFNKGDFTQQGVAGHVNANIRLNEKRLVNIDLTSNEDAEGCTIAGTVTDLLNNEVYGVGAGVSGNIEITENGENINVAPYATATVNVSGDSLPYLEATIQNDEETHVMTLDKGMTVILNSDNLGVDTVCFFEASETVTNKYLYIAPMGEDEYISYPLGYRGDGITMTAAMLSNLVNCTFDAENNCFIITDPSQNSSVTINLLIK